MVNLEECKNPDGSTDWAKYNELQRQETDARRAKGEICQRKRCNRFIVWSKGYPQTCQDCQNLDKAEELHHPDSVRCPKCGYHWRVGDGDYYELYGDGEHEVSCPDCGYEFEVTTWVSHTFVSPKRVTDESDGNGATE